MRKSLGWPILIAFMLGAGVLAGVTRAVTTHYIHSLGWGAVPLFVVGFWLLGSGNQKTSDLVDPEAVERLPPDKREQFNEIAEQIDEFNSWTLPQWMWGVVLACVVIIAGSALKLYLS